jgi:hypothetical protein
VPSAPTKPGTRLLSDVARHVVVPDGIVASGYPAVRDRCRDLGILHDDWQQGLGRLALAKRADGKYAATVGGVVLSIPRQVGKTFLVGSIAFALGLLYPGFTVIWTAHRTRTSNETFRKMQGLAGRSKVKPHVADIRRANGEQEITFANGSRIMFGAREQGFGRGFDEVDMIVFDEAQILTERALEDMVAATNQSRHLAGALLFYMGTPPRPGDRGEVFTEKRRKALSNKVSGGGNVAYVEMSADPGADPDDRAQVVKANPSVPARTPWESVARLRENVGSVESWLREGLGIWDDDGVLTAIPKSVWHALADRGVPPSPMVGRVWLAVDSTPERTRTSILAAGRREDGLPLVELVDNLPDVDWAAGRVIDLVARHEVAAVVIDKRGAAASLIGSLERAKVPVVGTDAATFARAWGQFYAAAVETGRVRHLDQLELNDAVQRAGLRFLGDALVPDRKKSSDDITPLIGAQLAFYGLVNEVLPEKSADISHVMYGFN